jgi:hypothetical protein
MKAPCSVDGCEKAARARGWCATHYSQWKRGRVVATARVRDSSRGCSVSGCDGEHYAKTLCRTHYARWDATGDPLAPVVQPAVGCAVEGCDGAHHAKGLCRRHWRRGRLYGDGAGRATA